VLAGVPRCIFGNFEGYKRALEIAKSPNVGICLCCGTWLEGGKELTGKWDIKYLGPDKTVTTDMGVPTDKLELVAKDSTVRKNIPKVTIWLDTARAVSLKQVFDLGEGQSRTCTYTNIEVNQSLPRDAFKFNK